MGSPNVCSTVNMQINYPIRIAEHPHNAIMETFNRGQHVLVGRMGFQTLVCRCRPLNELACVGGDGYSYLHV